MSTAKKSTTNKKSTARQGSAGRSTAASRNNTRTNKTNTTADGTEEQDEQQEQKESLLDKLFVNMLKDIYWAEEHLVDALTTMQEAASTQQLKDAFEDHKLQTQKHISRLERVFRLLGKEPEAKKCDAMEGLTDEAKAMMEETRENTMTRDAALIIAAQKVEHYEIATYGSLVQVALTLGHDQAADILEKTLWEEENTDKLLTQIAEAYVNPWADEEPAEMQMEEA